MNQAYFVTGTDTEIGKTLISTALMQHFVQNGQRVLGMKPVAAGAQLEGQALVNDDARQLQAASNVSVPLTAMNPYVFAPAIAPHLAARDLGQNISMKKIEQAFQALSAQADVVIVEGAGGFFVPLNDHDDMADLAAALRLPLVLVVGMRLGCINHSLLTVSAIVARGLMLAGWVANCVDPAMQRLEDNISTLRQKIAAPCLGVVPFDEHINAHKAAGFLTLSAL